MPAPDPDPTSCPRRGGICAVSQVGGALLLSLRRTTHDWGEGGAGPDPLAAWLGREAARVQADLFVLARVLGHVGGRRLRLGLPACRLVSADEMHFLCALSAAQGLDIPATRAHFAALLGRQHVPEGVVEGANTIADCVAGQGHVIAVPGGWRRVPVAATPAFRAPGA